MTVATDATAAMGIAQRIGIGELGHLDVGSLWVQEHLRSRAFALVKCHGPQNPADLFTKHLPREGVERHLWGLGQRRGEGRAATAPQLEMQRIQSCSRDTCCQ